MWVSWKANTGAKTQLEWLRQVVPLANGVLSYDCIEYVMTRLSPVWFRECFMNWTGSKRGPMNGLRWMGKPPAVRVTGLTEVTRCTG